MKPDTNNQFSAPVASWVPTGCFNVILLKPSVLEVRMAKNGRSSVETVVVGMSLKSEYNKLDNGQYSKILEIVTYSAR